MYENVKVQKYLQKEVKDQLEAKSSRAVALSYKSLKTAKIWVEVKTCKKQVKSKK